MRAGLSQTGSFNPCTHVCSISMRKQSHTACKFFVGNSAETSDCRWKGLVLLCLDWYPPLKSRKWTQFSPKKRNPLPPPPLHQLYLICATATFLRPNSTPFGSRRGRGGSRSGKILQGPLKKKHLSGAILKILLSLKRPAQNQQIDGFRTSPLATPAVADLTIPDPWEDPTSPEGFLNPKP